MPKISCFHELDTKRQHAMNELVSLALDHTKATRKLREIMDVCRTSRTTPSDSLMQSARDIQTQREKLEFEMTGVGMDMADIGIGGIGNAMVEQHIEFANEIMRHRP